MSSPNIDSTSGRSRKSADAYRTISEVADELHVPQHVLRFWETKFPRVKPLKRGGGRRYYRPDDVLLLRRIADLLYIQGYTIKGVQRLLKEGGGMLHEHIPPASPEEREAAQAERIGQAGERDLLATLQAGGPASFDRAALPVSQQSTAHRPPRSTDQRLTHARAALRDALALLEALRTSFG